MSNLLTFRLGLIFRREVRDMAVVYATLIVKGLKTIEQVPALIRKQTEEILAALDVTL